ncbi:MAG: 6-hydroxymethylpterin diphosphokinase MptE-like protein [Ignisphaera sp.]
MGTWLNAFRGFADWWIIYLDIVEKLGIDPKWDRLATEIAYRIAYFSDPPLETLKSLIIGQRVVVFGAGHNLENHINMVVRSPKWRKAVFIAADGASKALLENGLEPHIVVTDLDGDLKYIWRSVEEGSIPVVHVHGDNIDVVTRFLYEIVKSGRRFVVTTQIEPMYPIMNFGGFTDGDRAFAIAVLFNAYEILLAGMDFGDIVGRYSKPWLKTHEKASPRKKIKLDIAYEIVSMLSCEARSKIYTLSDTAPRCVSKISL